MMALAHLLAVVVMMMTTVTVSAAPINTGFNSLFKVKQKHEPQLREFAAGCTYASYGMPCWSWSEPLNSTLYEVSLSSASHVKSNFYGESTHEMSFVADRKTLFVTHQVSDSLTRIPYQDFFNPYDKLKNVQHVDNDTKREIMKEDGERANFHVKEAVALKLDTRKTGKLGVHQLLFPKHSLEYGLAYMTLEFFNNTGGIGIWNWTSNDPTPIKIIPVPLNDNVTGWTCFDWSAAATATEPCLTGTHPHTMTEDQDGNLWITLKNVGAIARLRNPDKTTSPEWRIYDLSRNGTNVVHTFTNHGKRATGPFPFYIQSDGKDTIWFNSITTSQIGVITNSTQDIPPSPILFTISHPKAKNNVRPGVLKVVKETGGAIFTLYQKIGTVAVAQIPPPNVVGQQQHDPNKVVVLPWSESSNHVGLIKLTHSDAFLAIDSAVQKNGLLTLWLAASSNDFVDKPSFDAPKILPHVAFAIPEQRDLLLKVTNFDPRPPRRKSKRRREKMTSLAITAPTQGSFLHRVNIVPCPNQDCPVLATQLKTDRLMVINPVRGLEKHDS